MKVKLRVFLWSLSHPKFLGRTAGVKCLVTAVAMEDKDLKLKTENLACSSPGNRVDSFNGDH